MALQRTRIISFFPLFLLLTACAGFSGDWPDLAEPYPSASERERVVEHAEPSAPIVFNDASPLNKSAAIKLLTSVRARLDKATSEYENIVSDMQNAISNEGYERQQNLWNAAQLSLTRLSHTASQLDAILTAESLSDMPVWENARVLKNQQEIYLAAARKSLAAFKPAG